MNLNRWKGESVSLILARIALAFSWIYQGAVPKLACMSIGEIELVGFVIKTYELACTMVVWMGYGEILFGAVLLFTRQRWVFMMNSVFLTLLVVYVAVADPGLLVLPFNPLTLNVALVALSAVAFLELKKSMTL